MSLHKKSHPLIPSKFLPRMIASIDDVIRNLSDISNIEYMENERNQAHKRKIGEITDTSTVKQPNDQLHQGGIAEQKSDNILLNSPPGLEAQYLKLCNLLRTGLLGIECNSQNNGRKHNVFALLMGPRGHGKSLVLERCIATLQREAGASKGRTKNDRRGKNLENQSERQNSLLCRIVRLNGTLLRGNNVGLAVKEIVRQLSEIAAKESFHNIQKAQQGKYPKPSTKNDPVKIGPEKSSDVEDVHPLEDNEKTIMKESLTQNLLKESYALRIRKGTFNSSLALLGKVLMGAPSFSLCFLGSQRCRIDQ